LKEQFKGGVVGVLSNSNPNDPSDYTVFAPTNDAFAKLGLVVALGALQK
jgi:hypothetical protein